MHLVFLAKRIFHHVQSSWNDIWQAFWNHILATKYSLIHNLSMILIFPAIFVFLFKKLKYNFAELLTINFYYFSSGLIITLIAIISYAQFFQSGMKTPLIIVVTFSYVIWANMSFFNSADDNTCCLPAAWWLSGRYFPTIHYIGSTENSNRIFHNLSYKNTLALI